MTAHTIFRTACLVFWVTAASHAVAAAAEPMNTVQRLFAAMSAKDEAAMRDTATTDFELLEVGEVWSMDKFANIIVSGPEGWTRRNYFSVITSHIDGDRAWVSYWNKADYSGPDAQQRTRRWLESAVLVLQNGSWKIQMLHSTRLQDDQAIPSDVVLEEYISP